MTVDEAVSVLTGAADAVARVRVPDADRSGCERVLAALAVLRRRADACEVRVTRRLKDLADADAAAPPPSATVADAGRTDQRQGELVERRVDTVEQVPALGDALERDDVAGAHLDVVAQVIARLAEHLRERFRAEHGEQLAIAAATMTPGELRHYAHRLAAAMEDDADRQARLRRQRRAVQLRWWIDRITGMLRISGEIDPERGQALLRRLQDEVEALFHGGAPDGALDGALDDLPDDPAVRQDHLRGLALLSVVLGSASGDSRVGRRPETITVIDLETFERGSHADSYVDLGVEGLELPLDTIRRRAALGRIVAVYTDADGVVVRVGDGSEPLDVGRATRLANRAQRRALRAMHPTCGVPGCRVPFDHCQPHHIRWWRHGGATDLRNLLPLCTKHHTAVHHDGWVVELGPARSVRVTRPDGTVLICGPPREAQR